MEKTLTTFERRQTIVRILQAESSARVTELARRLDVSEGTIRNDLIALDDSDQIMRVRGGAVPRQMLQSERPHIADRARVNANAKRRIARWAAGMIENGDVILLDASTTVLHIASFLHDRSNLTVVTNGIEVARMLAANPSNTVILLGGILRADGNAITGTLGEKMLQNLYIRTAFVSCAGFSIEAGLMETTLQEAQIKSDMMHSAQRTVALIDSSKFGKPGLTPFASLYQITYLATDTQTPIALIDQICQAGTHVVVCGESTVSSYTPANPQNKHYKIGFANISEHMAFGRDVRRGLIRAAEATNNIELLVADNQLSGEVALNVADSLIQEEINLAIEFQIDENVGNLIINKFKQSNIPVIAVDIPMVGATFFGVDNYQVGHIAGLALGEAVQKRWKGKFDYLVVLAHPRAGYLPAARIQGQIDGFREIVGDAADSDIIYLDSGNTSEISEREMSQLLYQLPDASYLPVICFNDDAALGALAAAEKLHRKKDVLIVGQGADRRLREKIHAGEKQIVGSTAFKPEQYGEKLIEIALQILEGKPVPPAVYMQHTFINAENIDQYYPASEDNR